MQKNRFEKDSNNSMFVVVVSLAVATVMVVSYIVALTKFTGSSSSSSDDEETSITSSESEVSEEVSVESSQTETSAQDYIYYSDLQLENCVFNNSDVKSGNLAIINGGDVPALDESELKKIGNLKSSVYGLSNMSLILYEDAIKNFDDFLVKFYESIPNNGLIINKGYNSSGVESDGTVDLASGYSVQFSIFNSSYKFTDTEFSFLSEQAYLYGVIERYPSTKISYTDVDESGFPYRIYRYVGLAHSAYMNHYNFCLEEYIDKIRTEKIIEFDSTVESNTAYVIYYVPMDSSSDTTYVPVPSNEEYAYTVSGDGSKGFIVTVKVGL